MKIYYTLSQVVHGMNIYILIQLSMAYKKKQETSNLIRGRGENKKAVAKIKIDSLRDRKFSKDGWHVEGCGDVKIWLLVRGICCSLCLCLNVKDKCPHTHISITHFNIFHILISVLHVVKQLKLKKKDWKKDENESNNDRLIWLETIYVRFVRICTITFACKW